MNHYKSWSGLSKQLSECLCEGLKGKITYFLTSYHEVHNSYGRAAIRLDGKEMISFPWMERYHQEAAISELYESSPKSSLPEIEAAMKQRWDADLTYCDMDFLEAALQFRNMTIRQALASENGIIRILAIMDRRVGRRTLKQIALAKEYKEYPEWVRQFYELRLSLPLSPPEKYEPKRKSINHR